MSMTGLTAQQAWTHEHILRCSCGSWLVVTDHELEERAADKWTPPKFCPHTNPTAMEVAA